MRRFPSAVLLVGVATGLFCGTARADDKEEAVKKDLKQLEGNWVMVRQELEGHEDSKSAKKNGVLFDGAEYKFLRDGKDIGRSATVSIDPTQDPKQIDFKITGGTAKGGTQLGVYRFTDDGQLEICLSQPRGKGSEKRPAAFTTKPSVGSGSILYVLEREKK